MTIFMNVLSSITLAIASSGASAASGWNLYQPTLPEQLRK